MDRLYIILLGIIQSEPNHSIDCQIANYLLEHIQDLSEVTSTSLAASCKVSKSSISRFCRRIGFHDFHELKYMLHNYTTNTTKFNFENHSHQEKHLLQYIDTIAYHIQQLTNTIDFAVLDEITEDIYRYTNVIIAGNLQANSVCLNLQLNLFSSGKIVQAKIKFSELSELILNAKENTLILVLSSTGSFFERLYQEGLAPFQHTIPKIYLITASAHLRRYPFIYKTIHLHAPSDFASGSLQLEIIANCLAMEYHRKTENHLFKSQPNSL